MTWTGDSRNATRNHQSCPSLAFSSCKFPQLCLCSGKREGRAATAIPAHQPARKAGTCKCHRWAERAHQDGAAAFCAVPANTGLGNNPQDTFWPLNMRCSACCLHPCVHALQALGRRRNLKVSFGLPSTAHQQGGALGGRISKSLQSSQAEAAGSSPASNTYCSNRWVW